jgi:hypothetical protein
LNDGGPDEKHDEEDYMLKSEYLKEKKKKKKKKLCYGRGGGGKKGYNLNMTYINDVLFLRDNVLNVLCVAVVDLVAFNGLTEDVVVIASCDWLSTFSVSLSGSSTSLIWMQDDVRPVVVVVGKLDFRDADSD